MEDIHSLHPHHRRFALAALLQQTRLEATFNPAALEEHVPKKLRTNRLGQFLVLMIFEVKVILVSGSLRITFVRFGLGLANRQFPVPAL